MARRKNLTALAALGTLGYMLSKRGDKASGKKDDKSTSDAAERRRAADKEASEEPLKVGDEFGMDPEEAANKRTERMLTNPNAREYGEAGTSMTVSPSKKPAKPSSGAAKAAPKLIDSSNIRSGPRFDDEGLIDPSNIRSGRREFEESQIAPASVDETKLSANERLKRSIERNLSGFRRGSTPTDYRPVNERFKKGGAVKGYASGGTVSSASKRADGIATKGKTRGKMY
jgi:hypothetical protein